MALSIGCFLACSFWRWSGSLALVFFLLFSAFLLCWSSVRSLIVSMFSNKCLHPSARFARGG